MTTPRVTLTVIDARIEARARAIREDHPWWPCGEGCDHCCRSLPRLPTITAAEWERLAHAIGLLPPNVRQTVLVRIEEAPDAGPLTCPMLDRERRTCLVYEARPVACRTYGFYVERDGGLHCNDVTGAVAKYAGDAPVVWGNGEAIADEVGRAFGETASLREWRRRGQPSPAE